jgi:hypothetical protein
MMGKIRKMRKSGKMRKRYSGFFAILVGIAKTHLSQAEQSLLGFLISQLTQKIFHNSNGVAIGSFSGECSSEKMCQVKDRRLSLRNNGHYISCSVYHVSAPKLEQKRDCSSLVPIGQVSYPKGVI